MHSSELPLSALCSFALARAIGQPAAQYRCCPYSHAGGAKLFAQTIVHVVLSAVHMHHCWVTLREAGVLAGEKCLNRPVGGQDGQGVCAQAESGRHCIAQNEGGFELKLHLRLPACCLHQPARIILPCSPCSGISVLCDMAAVRERTINICLSASTLVSLAAALHAMTALVGATAYCHVNVLSAELCCAECRA